MSQYTQKWPDKQQNVPFRPDGLNIATLFAIIASDIMTPTRTEIAEAVVRACHRLYARGYVTATDGNVSARLPNGNILMTPASVNKGDVRENLLVELGPDGAPVTAGHRPSTESGMHVFIYRERPDVNAVVHAHPTHATGFAAARVPMPANVLPEVIVGLGDIPLASYATPSTPDLAASLRPFVPSASAVLLANHGVVTFAPTVEEAYFKMEKVEHAAHILFVARMLGGERTLEPADVARLRELGATVYARRASESIPGNDRRETDLSTDEVKRLIRSVLEETGRIRR